MQNYRLSLFCVIVIAMSSLGACASKGDPSRTEYVLGTFCTITLFDQGKDSVYNEIFKRLHEIEDRMSVNIQDSDVSRINAAAGVAPVQVHDDVFDVIKRTLHFSEISGGALDPTVGPLVSLWGIGTDHARLPSQDESTPSFPSSTGMMLSLTRKRTACS